MHPDYVCPSCRAPLADTPASLRCEPCDLVYPVENEIADFSGGCYYDAFVPGQSLTADHRAGLEDEVSGTISRITDYYLPLLRKHAPRDTSSRVSTRVLDCGCGNGISVDLLNDAGLAAFGNDPSALRRWQWRERKFRDRLCVAGGANLPYRDGFFLFVISSGVLEHVGVAESNVDGYRVETAPDRDERRTAFLRELLRVLQPGGRIWLDFPNGAFPIDFWHGTTARRGARRHSRHEGFLPTIAEVRGYLAEIAPAFAVKALGPHDRLRLQRIRKHWYGRFFNMPARLFLQGISLGPMTRLAGTFLNPFLVLEISFLSTDRSRNAGTWT